MDDTGGGEKGDGAMKIHCQITHRAGAFELDLEAEAEGPVTALWGPSGAGKTTLTRAMAGLLRPQKARITLGDRVLVDTKAQVFIPPHKRGIGYIFQDVRLFPHLDVRGNLCFGMARGQERGTHFNRVVEILGLGELLDRRPFALSGGERQRVGIGRALLCAPELLIADEPLSALDAKRRREILAYFQMVIAEFKVPMIYVSHSLMELGWLAQDVWALDQGKLVAQGDVAGVLGDAAGHALGPQLGHATLLLRYLGQAEDGLWQVGNEEGVLFLTHEPQTHVGGLCPLEIAASDVILSKKPVEGISALNSIAAQIERITPISDHQVVVQLWSKIGRFQARITKRSAIALKLRVDQPIHAIIKTIALSDGR